MSEVDLVGELVRLELLRFEDYVSGRVADVGTRHVSELDRSQRAGLERSTWPVCTSFYVPW